MPGFYVQNFGCRATQADGAAIERQFEERGLERAGTIANAGIIVLNTCTVTASADQDARAAIRRVHRENPSAQIVVTGCYAQRSPEELASLPGVAQVIGNSHKHQLAEIALSQDFPPNGSFVPVSSLTEHRELGTALFVSDIFAHTELLAAPVFDAPNERTRPNLKVQDGCNNRCSFCVIPYVRGQSRSMRLDQVLREVHSLVAAGYRELVISGINLGRWGRDLEAGLSSQVSGVRVAPHHIGSNSESEGFSQRPTTNNQGLDFPSLIRAILDHTDLEKLRISSVEPMDWTDELIRLVADSPRIAKHAHVPMQSGSDAVLRRMHRKYRPWHYREKFLKIREAMPTAAIGADVMVGFPGESDAEFDETLGMIEDLPFTYLHVFTYSARPGTPAAETPRRVPVQIARERNRRLRELGEEKKLAFMRSFLGQTVEAITLAGRSELSVPDSLVRQGVEHVVTEALADNYLKVRLPGRHHPNRWVRARVSTVAEGAMIAQLSD
ncbi:MAG TPA: MiaB/RimO family radical SAM methylthiotransferase [Terriglobales bacterium]|nr:MiaB/RimO family radical SAM methylthiotransferase [Terriglobales bacterium]